MPGEWESGHENPGVEITAEADWAVFGPAVSLVGHSRGVDDLP